MDDKIKKFIAREGLVALGIITSSFLLCKLGNAMSNYVKGDIFDQVAVQMKFEKTAFILYPLYLVIRFILWAIKTLKTK